MLKEIAKAAHSLLSANALTQPLSHLFRSSKPRLRFKTSKQYWEDRYKLGGNSGAGSYNRLAEFKAHVLNDFVARNAVSQVLEFGCGDGAQLSLAQYPAYIGVDVAKTAVQACQDKFEDDPSKRFYTLQDLPDGTTADLTLSLDVIYHLVEDETFHGYMERLFDSSLRHVIVYASNTDELATVPHVRHRKFTDWIETHRPNWRLIQHIPNKYPLDNEDHQNTSFADFYIFQLR